MRAAWGLVTVRLGFSCRPGVWRSLAAGSGGLVPEMRLLAGRMFPPPSLTGNLPPHPAFPAEPGVLRRVDWPALVAQFVLGVLSVWRWFRAPAAARQCLLTSIVPRWQNTRQVRLLPCLTTAFAVTVPMSLAPMLPINQTCWEPVRVASLRQLEESYSPISISDAWMVALRITRCDHLAGYRCCSGKPTTRRKLAHTG